MGKNSNQKKGAFYFFMKEVQEKEARRGVRITTKSLANYAGPMWEKLSLEEKQPYEEEARRCKNDPSLRRGKLASDGTPIERAALEEEQRVREINNMKQAVKNYINADYASEEHFREFASRKIFYFVGFNILCQTENEYIPNEIGIIEYSILNGIHRRYHTFMHPGSIPTGYTGEAKRLMESDGGHGIDIFKGEKDSYAKVCKEIKNFIDPENSGELPPLFCITDKMEMSQGCFDTIVAYGRCRDNYFQVWNAVYLLLELRSGIGEPLPSEHIANELLSKTSYQNSDSNSCCSFHEEIDNHHCALLYANELGYLMSDSVCHSFNIEPTNKHLPEQYVKDKAYTIIEPKFQDGMNAMSITRSQPSRAESRSTYYAATEEDTFSDIRSVASSNVSTARKQPTTRCVAEVMSRLNLKTAPTTGHYTGIGRGKKPPQ